MLQVLVTGRPFPRRPPQRFQPRRPDESREVQRWNIGFVDPNITTSASVDPEPTTGSPYVIRLVHRVAWVDRRIPTSRPHALRAKRAITPWRTALLWRKSKSLVKRHAENPDLRHPPARRPRCQRLWEHAMYATVHFIILSVERPLLLLSFP